MCLHWCKPPKKSNHTLALRYLHFSNWINVLRKDDVLLEYASDLFYIGWNFLQYFKKLNQKFPFSSCTISIRIIHKMKSFTVLSWRSSRGEAKWENLCLYKLGKHGGLVGRILWLRNVLQLATVPTSCSTAKQASSLWRLPKRFCKIVSQSIMGTTIASKEVEVEVEVDVSFQGSAWLPTFRRDASSTWTTTPSPPSIDPAVVPLTRSALGGALYIMFENHVHLWPLLKTPWYTRSYMSKYLCIQMYSVLDICLM